MKIASGTHFGRYEIRSQLGAGGMGEVYLAEDTRLHRKVALKILPAELASNQDRMRRFVQEAEAAAALNHPHIAHIYEIGSSPTVKEGLAHGSTTENVVHFIAMEFIDGDTLREKIYRDKIPLPKLLGYLNQVAEGLNKAHASGIVHRDLKPDNIMITHDGYAKILDFGLANFIEARKTFETGDTASSEIATAVMRQQSIPGMVMGTVGYMSPEQATGRVKEIDHRSDIFSFGCILFEAATGQKAFEGKDVLDSLHKIVHAPTPQIKDFNLTAPVDLQRIVRRCLAKDPEDRYQTIKEVVIELKELRREVENAAEVELSITPETTADPHVSKTGDRTISVGDKTAASTAESVAHSTSSAEYVVGEVKKHKLGAMIVVALLALVVAGLGYGIYRLTAKRDKPALSFQSAKFTRLTTTRKASGVAISPDGKYVVHIQDDGGQQSLWMRQTATQSNVQIMPPAVNVKYSRLMFSPDGDYLFYVARENNAAPALYQIPALGGSPRKLSPNVGNFMALSPDGARVASIRRAPDEGKDVLVVSNVDGSGERRLVERKIPERMLYAGGRGSAPAWSPEGHRIAFASYEYGIVYANVVVAQVDSGVEETLSSEKWYNMGQLAWLSDGSGVVMLASDQRGYPPQLWHLSYPEGSARRITNDLNSYTTVSVTADSRSLVTVQTETLSTIWVAPERDSNGARQISFGTAKIDEGAVWTPDGRIVYESRTGDNINIWIMNADGSNQKQLTFDNGRTPDVSPDGRYIVFRSNRSVTPHIYRMEMDGSNLKQLTDGTGEFGPRMTPDGKWVYFSSRSSGNLTVWRASIDGGKNANN